MHQEKVYTHIAAAFMHVRLCTGVLRSWPLLKGVAFAVLADADSEMLDPMASMDAAKHQRAFGAGQDLGDAADLATMNVVPHAAAGVLDADAGSAAAPAVPQPSLPQHHAGVMKVEKEMMMTRSEAEAQNTKLPKGYKYVRADEVGRKARAGEGPRGTGNRTGRG
mmetsp:Transcript_29907/g.66181  ORF Transcript_29907/g.66181 Transcript_29907/m.66181 type:complete len:165 (+) Transcript_29907:280-774(+)